MNYIELCDQIIGSLSKDCLGHKLDEKRVALERPETIGSKNTVPATGTSGMNFFVVPLTGIIGRTAGRKIGVRVYHNSDSTTWYRNCDLTVQKL